MKRRGGLGYFRDESFPYVTFATKRAMADEYLETLRAQGKTFEPVVIEDGVIARTWWAKAWNKNLESYADYKSRIARGRMYLKNDTVLDLKIEKSSVTALVQGAKAIPYTVTVQISPLSETKWKRILSATQHQIEGLGDLVEGRFPKELATLFTVKEEGLFPSTKEIEFACTCMDKASMCKHVAAVLYGIGARFDTDPTLFFKLRDIDFNVLLAKSIDEKMQNLLQNADKKSDRAIEDEDIFDLFGL